MGLVRGRYAQSHMDAYRLALFIHVAGTVIVFASYGALLFSTAVLRLARTTEEVRGITKIVAGRKLGFEYVSAIDLVVIVGGAFLVVGGAIMATSTWGWNQPWIQVSIVTVVAIGLAAAFVRGPRLHRIGLAVAQAPGGELPESLRKLIRDRVATAVLYAATGALVGVVFLMTNKPSLGAAVVAVITPSTMGMAAAYRLRTDRPSRPPDQ